MFLFKREFGRWVSWASTPISADNSYFSYLLELFLFAPLEFHALLPSISPDLDFLASFNLWNPIFLLDRLKYSFPTFWAHVRLCPISYFCHRLSEIGEVAIVSKVPIMSTPECSSSVFLTSRSRIEFSLTCLSTFLKEEMIIKFLSFSFGRKGAPVHVWITQSP